MENTPQAVNISILQLLYLNCIVCGLELTSSAAITYLPPMLLEAGFDDTQMSWVLGLGPCLCVIIVPLMGRKMDTCTSRYGRRIPFMTALSLLVLISLILIPYADHNVPSSSGETIQSIYSVHACLLAFSVILIDFATQAGMTPCEVFLQDVTAGLPIRDKAFSLYSLMCSLGSCVGYLITATNWEKTLIGMIFGDQEYCVFSLLVVIFLILMIITLYTASTVRKQQSLKSNSTVISKQGHNMSISQSAAVSPWHGQPFAKITLVERFVSACMPQTIVDLFMAPYALRRLVYANFFAWAGVMCFLLFYSDYVGEIVYAGKPSSAVGTVERLIYDEGVRMGSLGLFLHAVTSSICAPFIEKLQQCLGKRALHMISLGSFTISLCFILLTNNLIVLNALTMVTGLAFASMTTIPFSLVGMYHESKEVYLCDNHGSSTYRGLGTDMATLDTAYFCSQVMLLAFMGYIVQLTGTASSYIATAAGLSAISCYFIYTSVYTEQDVIASKQFVDPPLPLLAEI